MYKNVIDFNSKIMKIMQSFSVMCSPRFIYTLPGLIISASCIPCIWFRRDTCISDLLLTQSVNFALDAYRLGRNKLILNPTQFINVFLKNHFNLCFLYCNCIVVPKKQATDQNLLKSIILLYKDTGICYLNSAGWKKLQRFVGCILEYLRT